MLYLEVDLVIAVLLARRVRALAGSVESQGLRGEPEEELRQGPHARVAGLADAVRLVVALQEGGPATDGRQVLHAHE